jgi:hypothetical protein
MNPNQAFQMLFRVNSISENECRIRQFSEHLARDVGMTRSQLIHKIPSNDKWPRKLFGRKYLARNAQFSLC